MSEVPDSHVVNVEDEHERLTDRVSGIDRDIERVRQLIDSNAAIARDTRTVQTPPQRRFVLDPRLLRNRGRFQWSDN